MRRGRSYDAVELEGVAQQKCLAHLIRNAAKVVEEKTGRAGRRFGQQVIDTLRRSLSLSAQRTEMRQNEYSQQALALDDELAHLLRDRTLRDADNSGCSMESEHSTIAAGCCAFWPRTTSNPPTTAQDAICDRP